MDEVSLSTLLLNGECDVQWGTRGSSTAHRTIEIHSNNILYCFVEPKDSMAKHAKEKVYLDGCHVVDGGACGSGGGAGERLLLFLVNYDYAESVDLVGNHRAFIFAPEEGIKAITSTTAAAPLPGANYVVQLFLMDKMLKWRLLQAIQRASQEYGFLFRGSPTDSGLTSCGVPKSTTPNGNGRGSFVHVNVPNHFESKVLVHTPPPSSSPERQSSDISVLSDHEVLQLSDVLREYDAAQQQKTASARITSLHVAQEDMRRAPTAEMLGEEEEACLLDNIVDSSLTVTAAAAAAFSLNAVVPAGLQHSPLYESCIYNDCANQVCADCGAAFPCWCLLQPFGAFLCIECIGVHRKLWPNKCRGAELDLWPAADITFMQSRGNAVVNAELEYYVAFPADSVEAAMQVDPPVKPVASFSSINVRESYIQWKYEEQLFTQKRHPNVKEPLPPPSDPVGVEHSRLAAASNGTAAAATSEPEGNGDATSSFYTSPTHQQQQRALHRDDGPPRYAGLLDVIVKELVGPECITGAVCVLTNGFQTLSTHVSRQLLHMRHSTAWDEHLQLGIEGRGQKPIYCTIYRGKGELLATGEVWLTEEVFQPGTNSMFAATLTWSQLHKKASQRKTAERWEITFLTSYKMLL